MGVRRSTYFAFGSRHASVLTSFVAIAVIARLLTPEEIGVFTVSAAFVTLSQILRDFGIGSYLIQARELDRKHIRAAMGIGLLIGIGLAATICLLAVPLAGFYGQPGVATVLYILSGTFVLMPVNGVGLALLKRELKFGMALWLEAASNLVWAISAIILAYHGESYRSLAWGTVAGAIAMLLMLVALRRELVMVRPSFVGWRAVVGFGSVVALTNLIAQIGLLSPAIVMGRLLGFSDVAFFNRGNSITRIFRDTVESGARMIALPAFSDQMRRGSFDRDGYLYATTLITGVSWPFFCGLALTAYPTVRILFGDQWDAAVPVVQLLSVANLLNALVILAPSVIVALGAIKLSLYREIVVQGLRVGLVIACAFDSFEAVAAAQIAVYAATLVINEILLRRLVGLTVRDLMRAVMPSLVLTAISAAGPLVVALLFPATPSYLWPPFLAAIGTGAAGWLAAAFVIDHPVAGEIALLLRKLRSLRASPGRA
jgi:O-antigen/teichoic acid export membrane protein